MPKYFFINGFNFFGNSYLFKIHFEQILVPHGVNNTAESGSEVSLQVVVVIIQTE